eukprot:jgi/Bigna1/91850/estExt_fgenesh1_pg.C_1240014
MWEAKLPTIKARGLKSFNVMEPDSSAQECLKWTDTIRKPEEYESRKKRTNIPKHLNYKKFNFLDDEGDAIKCLEWDDEKSDTDTNVPTPGNSKFQKFMAKKRGDRDSVDEAQRLAKFMKEHCSSTSNYKHLEKTRSKLFGSVDQLNRYTRKNDDDFQNFYQDGLADPLYTNPENHICVVNKNFKNALAVETRLKRAFRSAGLGKAPKIPKSKNGMSRIDRNLAAAAKRR